MSIFTDSEIEYMHQHRLGALATVTKSGDPHVVPVNYMYNPEFESIDIIGREMAKSQKYKNIVGFGRASFLVDDVVSLMPYRTRFLHLRGMAEIVLRKPDDPLPMPPSAPKMAPEMVALRQQLISTEMIRIHVEKIVSAGLEDDPAEVTSRSYGPGHVLVGTRRNSQPYGGDDRPAARQPA
jgi:pyridoxamine 5'-phosphate oxidase family protein